MQIKSSFAEYYDSIQYYGDFDNSLVWDRMVKEIDNPFPNFQSRNISSRIIREPFIVGFCGTLYGGMRVEIWKEHPKYVGKNSWFHAPLIHDRISYFYDILKMYQWIFPHRDSKFLQKYIQRELSNGKPNLFFIRDDPKLFVEHKAPIFVAYKDTVYLHNLVHEGCRDTDVTVTRFGLEGLVGDCAAFMRLESYIRFLLQEHQEIPEMDDKTKRDGHGFDNQSFKHRRA